MSKPWSPFNGGLLSFNWLSITPDQSLLLQLAQAVKVSKKTAFSGKLPYSMMAQYFKRAALVDNYSDVCGVIYLSFDPLRRLPAMLQRNSTIS